MSANCRRGNTYLRRMHLAGDKLFIDYSGTTIPIVNPEIGEVRKAQILLQPDAHLTRVPRY